MTNLRQFKLPDVGEGLTEGEILQWLVAVGDTVTVNQPLCEVETAKAAVELPSPYAGTVTELLFEAGTMVDVGTPIITIDVGGGSRARADARPPAEPAPGRADAEPAAGLIGGAAPGGRTAVLVGYGPRNTEAKRRPRRGGAAAARATAPRRPADRAVGDSRPPLLTTAPDAGTKPVRHGGLEVGRQAEAHALGEAAAPVGRGRRTARPAAAAGQAAGAQVRQGPRRRPRPPSPAAGDGGVITRADVDAAVAGPRRTGAASSGRSAPRRPDDRRRAADPDQGRPQAHRRRDGGQRVHRAARHGVPDRRRHPDDEAARRGSPPARSWPASRSARCCSWPRRCCSRCSGTRWSTARGTRRPRRSWSRTT